MKISAWSGFRTSKSMQSQEHWQHAHLLSSHYLLKLGTVLMIYCVIAKLTFPITKEVLSLINNAIYIIAFIAVTIHIDSKI